MKRDEEGVHSIANTQNPDRVADIVFIHGLQGSSHATWEFGKKGGDGYFFWPEQLGVELTDCGIWSVGYSAGVTEFGKPGMLIEKRALNLVSQFGVKRLGVRPIFFICHSMGGLLVKEIAVRGALPSDAKHSQLVKNIKGIIFCGTPHRGSAIASLASFFGVAQKHVSQMKSNEETLDLAHERFVKWHQSNPIEILTFAESHALKRQKIFGGLIPRVMVVPRASANPDMGSIHDVDADHLSLVKPKSGDLIYEASLDWLRALVKSLNNQSAVIQDASVDPSPNSATHAMAQSASSALLMDLGSEKEERLKLIQKKLSEGYYAAAEQDVRGMMANAAIWRVLSVATRAKAYRALIHAVIKRQLKTADATRLLSQAKAECPSERFVTTEALIAITDGNEKAMLETYPVPVTEQEWRWKLLLLINDEQYGEAIRTALDPAASFPCSTAIQSCLTWAYLGLKKLEEARQFNQLALESDPECLGNLEAKALIEYGSAISPSSASWLATAYPLPAELECIYTTSLATGRLSQAAELFEKLATRMDAGSVLHLRYLTWSLACWCNLTRINSRITEKAEERALAIFEKIQEYQPAFPLSVQWALLAHLPINLAQLETICLSKLIDPELETIDTLCHIYLNQDKLVETAELMDRFKDCYRGLQSCQVWRHYRIQLAGSLGQAAIVRGVLSEAANEDERLQLHALSFKAAAVHGSFKEECINAHVALWTHTRKVTDLFSACEMHLRWGFHEFAVNHIDTLLQDLPSRQTLLLALTALNNAQEWSKSLQILNEHRDLFDDENSAEFLQFESEAYYQMGEFSIALDLLKQAVQKHPIPQNTVAWFDKAVQAGNHQHMIESAQLALQTNQSPAEHLLHMADHLAPVHPEFTRQIFDAASAKPQIKTPNIAAFAFILANKLGISDELAPEVIKSALSPGGPMKAFTYEQVVELLQEQQNVRAKHEEKYRLGQVYIHAFADATGYPISAIIHDACPPASGDYFAAPTRLWSARLRHGRRHTFAEPPLSSPWKLHLDVTSILLAHRLGVLRTLEKSDAHLSISPKTTGLLLEELKRLGERQPSREQEVDQLLALIDSGRIRVTSQSQSELPDMQQWADGMTQNWKSAFSAAVESEGVLIDFWPLNWDFEPNRRLEVPKSLLIHVGGPSGLIQGMIEAGWIEQEILSKTQKHNAFYTPSPSVHLDHTSRIILDTEIARSLLNVGALDSLISSCKVWITYEEEQRCREAQRQARYKDELLASVDALQKHLLGELGKRYKAGPASTLVPHHQNDSLWFNSLLDFTAAAKAESILLVSEDRWMTGFLTADNAPLVGLLDVLFWLYKVHRLAAPEFFGCLHRLRLGNARFIPLCKEELLYRLKTATNLHTKELRETPELEVIRRYYAACFLDTKSMQFKNVADLSSTEIGFLTHIIQVIASVLASLWIDEQNEDIKDNKARWLLHALFTDILTLVRQQVDARVESETDRQDPLADLFCLFCLGCWKGQNLDMLIDRAGAFATWLISSLKAPAQKYQHFYLAIQRMLSQCEDDHVEPEIRKGTHRFATRIIMGLMKEGGKNVILSDEERNRFGIVQVILIEGRSFERNKVWEAIGTAMSGNAATLLSHCRQLEYQVSSVPDSKDSPVVLFSNGQHKGVNFELEELALASPEIIKRKSFLLSKRSNLDLSKDQAQPVFESIANLESPAERVEQFYRLQEASTTVQFERFLDSHQSSVVTLTHINKEARPLGCASLLRHAGLKLGSLKQQSLMNLMTEAAPRLIEDYGLFFAFLRQASLPVALPEIWAERIFALTNEDLVEFIQPFEDITFNPMVRLQLASLLLRQDSPAQERGRALFDLLIGETAKESWGFFSAVLKWSWRCLAALDEDFSQEEMWICAWLHAGTLQLWLPRPLQSKELITAFNGLENTPTTLFENQDSCPDLAHPLHFSAKWLLLHAVPQLISLHKLSSEMIESLTGIYRSLLFSSRVATRPEIPFPGCRVDWTNRLGTFLGPASEELLSGWVTDEQQVWINQEALLIVIQRHCENAENADSSGSWLSLSNALVNHSASDPIQATLRVQLEAFSISRLQLSGETSAQHLWGIARFVVSQGNWYRTADDVYWMTILDSFLDALEKLGDTSFEKSAVDLAFALSCAQGNTPSTRAAIFADTVIQITRKRPSIATETWEMISVIVQAQKSNIQSYLWFMLAEVRALASRST